jgi:hypothetical protein
LKISREKKKIAENQEHMCLKAKEMISYFHLTHKQNGMEIAERRLCEANQTDE